jgi:hypothetical protein
MVLVKKEQLASIWKQELFFYITSAVVLLEADSHFVKMNQLEMTTISIKD